MANINHFLILLEGDTRVKLIYVYNPVSPLFQNLLRLFSFLESFISSVHVLCRFQRIYIQVIGLSLKYVLSRNLTCQLCLKSTNVCPNKTFNMTIASDTAAWMRKSAKTLHVNEELQSLAVKSGWESLPQRWILSYTITSGHLKWNGLRERCHGFEQWGEWLGRSWKEEGEIMQIQFLYLLLILHCKFWFSDPIGQSSLSSDTDAHSLGVPTSQTNKIYSILSFTSADLFLTMVSVVTLMASTVKVMSITAWLI